MGIRYYTHFTINEEGSEEQEFSGVVETNRTVDSSETNEIEILLAKNFDLKRENVQLLEWGRLQ